MATTVRIFLKGPSALRDTEAGKKFAPPTRLCECGKTLHFYCTYPNEKQMPFDEEPTLVGEPDRRDDGALIATVSNKNVHFVTCPIPRDKREKKESPTHGFVHHDAR